MEQIIALDNKFMPNSLNGFDRYITKGKVYNVVYCDCTPSIIDDKGEVIFLTDDVYDDNFKEYTDGDVVGSEIICPSCHGRIDSTNITSTIVSVDNPYIVIKLLCDACDYEKESTTIIGDMPVVKYGNGIMDIPVSISCATTKELTAILKDKSKTRFYHRLASTELKNRIVAKGITKGNSIC